MSGVFGAYSQSGSPVLEDIYLGLYALQHRGQLSAGVAWINNGVVRTKKNMGLVHEALNQHELAKINAHTAIGHVRHITDSDCRIENSQPLVANYAQGPVAIAHNGSFTNVEGLIGYLENRGAIFQSSSDTETVLQLMAHQPGIVQLEALKTALSKVQGAYSMVVLFDNCLIAARDPSGFRPLVLGQKNDTYYVASESCALDILGAKLIRDIKPGEILVIDKRGIISQKIPVQEQKCSHCSFEYVYFARPDSVIDGRSVYCVRKKLGACLKKNISTENAVVTGMPDSGTIAALGLAEKLNLPFEIGIIRNRYVGRTFIHLTERVREAGVKIKLNPQSQVLKDKNVIIVDDSLVRGTTARRIVKMIRDSGAKKVHMHISSPPIVFPCYYGINTPSSKELIAAQMDISSLCEKIGADSLNYLTCEDLVTAIGIPKEKLCTACFDGSYLENKTCDNLLEV